MTEVPSSSAPHAVNPTPSSSFRHRSATALTWIILLSLLVLGFTWGNAFAYPALFSALLGMAFAWNSQTYTSILGRPWAWMLLAAFVLLSVAGYASATSVREQFGFVSFLPLLLTIPAAALFAQARVSRGTTLVAALALLGTITAVVTSSIEAWQNGLGRSSAPEISPIHYADLAMIAGFMALAGLMVPGTRWRALFWLGPLLGFIAGILAGTRAALTVGVVLAPFAVFFLARALKPRPMVLAGILVAGAVLVAGTAALAISLGLGRAFEATGIVGQMLSGGTVADGSVHFRLDMYQAALKAIGHQPFFGFGWKHQLEAILPYMSPEGQSEYTREHWGYVHNEMLSFVTGMGPLGGVAYLLLLGFPIVAAWTTPADSQSLPRVYLCLTVTIGMLVSGLSDVLFMVELPKTFFCFLPAAIVLLCRDASDAA